MRVNTCMYRVSSFKYNISYMCTQITWCGLNIGRLTCLKRNELRFENRYILSAYYTPNFRTGVIVFIIVRTDVSSERIVVNVKYIRFVLND